MSIFVFEIPFCLPVLEYRLAGSGTVCQGAPVASGILDTVLFSLEVPLSVHTAKRILFCGQDLWYALCCPWGLNCEILWQDCCLQCDRARVWVAIYFFLQIRHKSVPTVQGRGRSSSLSCSMFSIPTCVCGSQPAVLLHFALVTLSTISFILYWGGLFDFSPSWIPTSAPERLLHQSHWNSCSLTGGQPVIWSRVIYGLFTYISIFGFLAEPLTKPSEGLIMSSDKEQYKIKQGNEVTQNSH